MFERDIVLEGRQLDVIGIAVRFSEQFCFGTNDGALDFGDVDVNDVVGVFDDAGLEQHDEFTALLFAGVRSDEILQDWDFAQYGDPGVGFTFLLADNPSEDDDASVGDGDLGRELV